MLDWQLLETIDPWGEKRADYRAAVICYIIACCMGSSKHRPKLEDYKKYFDFNPEQKNEDDDDWLEKIKK